MFESAFEMGSFEPSRFLQPPPHGGAEAWKAQQVSSVAALGSHAAPRRSLMYARRTQMPVRSLPTNTEIVFTSVQSMGGNTDSTGLSTAEYDKRHAHEFV